VGQESQIGGPTEERGPRTALPNISALLLAPSKIFAQTLPS
jgi:hypothetical protein